MIIVVISNKKKLLLSLSKKSNVLSIMCVCNGVLDNMTYVNNQKKSIKKSKHKSTFFCLFFFQM
jgi:hypothetical protein